MSIRPIALACLAAMAIEAAAAGAADSGALIIAEPPLRVWAGKQPAKVGLVDRSKQPVGLETFHGQVLVVNLWATWCVPCRQEMPSLDRLRQNMAGKKVAVVAVNLGDSDNQINQFLARVPVDLTILLDRERDLMEAWNISVLPTTYIFDPRGKLRYSYAGERDWSDATVRRAIESLLPK